MLVKFNNDGKEHTVNLDQAIVWGQLEEDLKLTVNQAHELISEGSTKVITYAIWLAAEVDRPYKEWLKKLGTFDVVDDYPKDTSAEA